jgi:hypothetical protein
MWTPPTASATIKLVNVADGGKSHSVGQLLTTLRPCFDWRSL